MSSNPDGPSRTQSIEEALDNYKKSVGDEIDRFFDEATIQSAREKTRERKEEPRLEITNYGRIGYISLPPGWVETQQPAGEQDRRRFREFHPPDKPRVKICFFFRGHRTGQESAQAFQSILSKPTHVLTRPEYASVAEIVRDKAEASSFKLLVAATRELAGKKVLIVEGRYKESQEEVHALHIDGDGTGTIVQEVYFQAPRDTYPLHFAEASASFKSIQWK